MKKLLSYSVYRKTLLAYSISIFAITVLILTILYSVFISSIKRNTIESTQQLLIQLVEEVNAVKTDVDIVISVITNDSKTLKFIQNRKENKQDNYFLFLKLQEVKSSYSYIEDLSVLNLTGDICIQAVGSNGYADENIRFAAAMKDRYEYIVARTIRLSRKEKNVVSFLQYLPFYNAAVIVDVDAGLFQYSIAENYKDMRKVDILDASGKAVIKNTDTYSENKALSDYFYSTIQKQKVSKESFVYDDKNKKQMIFFTYSQAFDWWFIDTQDYSYFDGRFHEVSSTFIGIALAAVVICLLISTVFNYEIRKLLNRLINRCRTMIESEESYENDELKYLDIALARGKHEKYLRENYIRELYLHNIILGEQMPLFVLQKDLDRLKEKYHAEYYCVMLLKIQNLIPLEDTSREDEYKLYRYVICNLSDEIFGKNFSCKSADMGEELVALLFFLDKKDMEGDYVLCFRQLKEYIEEIFQITVSGSLGLIVEEAKDIFVSYQKARQYLEMNELISREELIDANNRISINYQEKNRKLVESIIEYTEYNFDNPDLSLKSISQIFGLSTTYLGKIFRSIQEEAYASFVTNYRLEKSKTILLHTTKTIHEIAQEIGFTNSAYYATLFKNTYGITPTAFRNSSKLITPARPK